MSLMVTGIATVKATGFAAGFVLRWMGVWGPSWAVAFPAVMLMAPIARRLVARMTLEG